MGPPPEPAETAGCKNPGLTRAGLKRQSGLLVLHVEGHSRKNTAVDVCSAVSILVETLEAALDLLAHLRPSVQKADGLFHLTVQDSQESSLLVASTLLGLQMLAKLYPDAVTIDPPEFE